MGFQSRRRFYLYRPPYQVVCLSLVPQPKENQMKVSLVGLVIGCAAAGSAIAAMESPPFLPPQGTVMESPPYLPPQQQ